MGMMEAEQLGIDLGRGGVGGWSLEGIYAKAKCEDNFNQHGGWIIVLSITQVKYWGRGDL